jgi:hypothetical protein
MLAGHDLIVKDPEILGGIAVVRGTRVPFKNLLDYLEGGHTLGGFWKSFHRSHMPPPSRRLEHAKHLVIAQTR